MIKRGWIALFAAIIAFTAASVVGPCAPVHAQSAAPEIAQAELRLWPEYDDPGLLVIFSGAFAEGTPTPVQVALPIAPGARNIQATFMDESGTLINRPFEVKDNVLTYEVPSATFHIEYYVDRAPSAAQRNIEFTFDAPYAIDALQISIQQPARATDFSVQPAADGSEPRADGLTYHTLIRSNVAAGQELGLSIRYTKTDSALSAPQLAVTTTEGPAPDTTAATTLATTKTNLLPWLLIGLGVALLAGIGAYWFLSQRRQKPAGRAAPARSRAGTRAPEARGGAGASRPSSSAATAAAAFCTQCGAPLHASDRFCPQCGTRRRA